MNNAVRKRSVVVAGHRTSISLEEPFWRELKSIALARRMSLNALVAELDQGRVGNLSSTLRVYVLSDLQRRLSAAETVPSQPSAADSPSASAPSDSL
jgi:predicted DNA-binding ribbon-helix-helix protein